MTFEKVSVTTGDSNDYYIEISGDALSDGNVIRSSADLSEGIETQSNENSSKDSGGLFANLFGGSNGGREMHNGGNRQGGTPQPD